MAAEIRAFCESQQQNNSEEEQRKTASGNSKLPSREGIARLPLCNACFSVNRALLDIIEKAQLPFPNQENIACHCGDFRVAENQRLNAARSFVLAA